MASSGIPLDTGALMSAMLETILYGFSVLMFIGTILSFTYKQHVRDTNRLIFAVAILLLILSTAHVVVSIIRVEDGLVKDRDTYPGGPTAFFADVSQETYVIKHALYTLQTLLADGVVIYRCYIVWQSVWVITLPIILWCSVAVTGIHAVYSASQYNTGVFDQELATWIIGFFISTTAANVLSSGLLAYRIWAIDRNIASIRASAKGTMMPIIHVLVDAAALYSVALVTALICFLRSNNGESVMVDLVMPIISISFYMVPIRVAINRHHSCLSTVGTIAGTEQGNLQKYPMKPWQVYASQLTRSDSTSAYGIGNEHQPSGLQGGGHLLGRRQSGGDVVAKCEEVIRASRVEHPNPIPLVNGNVTN
ncbi:hypothetical protein CY34DRAFT_71616 [Suillus luteus UH-Slu-Lm8-n1]|uniref:Uncharacterized protein n=1 Tax=Suillus luteus UH-Slu-Lm8-n1 TaxID=930992 RepID=A0A0D0B3F1_9AGAM|nr:hypothetical protein CY34DRAFT_71616 [Suillus luteus UH-Slu-Lm8-n1]